MVPAAEARTLPAAGDPEGGISRWLRVRAREQPQAWALVCARARHGLPQRMTFAQLDRMTDEAGAGLQALGIEPGDRVIVMVEPGVGFFALAFAVFRIGAVMIGVDPGMGIARVRTALASCEASAFVASPKALLARILFRWGESSVRRTVTLGGNGIHRVMAGFARARGLSVARGSALTLDWLLALGRDRPFARTPVTAPDDDAAILFTSGSTGPPKGVVYRHRHFDAQLRALAGAYAITPGECELATFPLFALFAPALGMCAVIPTMDFTQPGRADPEHLLSLIATEGVTSMFGSPALVKRLGQRASENDPRLGRLARVVSAGAPVPAATLERLKTVLPRHTRVHTPYGATEALPVTSIEADEILRDTREATERGAGVCVGRPSAGMEVRIVPVADGPLDGSAFDPPMPPGAVGEITVRGPVVTERYEANEDANRLAKIATDSGTFHRMGDLGYFDLTGRLWFCGRKSQRVRTARGDLHTIPCEAVFNRHRAIARSALVGIEHQGRTTPVIVVELEPRAPWDSPAELSRLEAELGEIARAHPHTAQIAHFLFHPRFPVDPRHNAKIGREALCVWAQRRLR